MTHTCLEWKRSQTFLALGKHGEDSDSLWSASIWGKSLLRKVSHFVVSHWWNTCSSGFVVSPVRFSCIQSFEFHSSNWAKRCVKNKRFEEVQLTPLPPTWGVRYVALWWNSRHPTKAISVFVNTFQFKQQLSPHLKLWSTLYIHIDGGPIVTEGNHSLMTK